MSDTELEEALCAVHKTYQARIRELEADAERWAALAGANLPQLQTRIRELEDMVAHPSRFPQYKELELQLKDEQAMHLFAEKKFIDRISKAEAILRHILPTAEYVPEIVDALKALEGK